MLFLDLREYKNYEIEMLKAYILTKNGHILKTYKVVETDKEITKDYIDVKLGNDGCLYVSWEEDYPKIGVHNIKQCSVVIATSDNKENLAMFRSELNIKPYVGGLSIDNDRGDF